MLCVVVSKAQPKGMFASIGAAIKAASDGALIQVAAGHYRENVTISAKRLTLLGGFSPDFTFRQPASQITTVQGTGGDATLTVLDSKQAIVDGLRIIGGSGNELQKKYFILGGGVYLRGGRVTLANSLIENNDVIAPHRQRNLENAGGGVFAEDGEVTIIGNLIRSNVAGRGAGIAAGGCSQLTIRGNAVRDNTALGDHGGGIYVSGPKIVISGNIVWGNRVTFAEGSWGGGILVHGEKTHALLSENLVSQNQATAIGSGVFIDDGAVAELRNERIVNNRCSPTGGVGVYVDGLEKGVGSRATITNCTIAYNRCLAGRGLALYVETSSKVVVKNSILWGHDGADVYRDETSNVAISYSLTQQRLAGKGNLHSDPLFASQHDLHLRSTAGRWLAGKWVKDKLHSPAIDAADPKDEIGQETVPHGKRRNLGAYGGSAEASRGVR